MEINLNQKKGYIMPTQLGIFLRKLRLDSGELSKEMATKLDVSSSFLSAVENGKKKMPESWYDTVVNLYYLDEEKQNELKQAIENSQRSLESSNKEKKRSLSFEKTLKNMDKEEIDKIKMFLTNS